MRRRRPKLNIFIICSLIHLKIAMYTLGFSHNKSNCIRNLETCPKKEFFTMELLPITNKSNERSFEINFNLLAISKVKCRSNHLYLKMVLLLSSDLNLNPGLVNRYQVAEHKFKALSSKETHSDKKMILTTFLLK